MSKIFTLTSRDFVKGLVIAVIAAVVTPLVVAAQAPDFSVFDFNWTQYLVLAANGAFVTAISYLAKNFFSDKEGKFGGVI